jgi:AcrR family transcriptional regulator
VRRTGRPPLTERRRAATRLEIANAAIRLFTAKGVAATSAEEIADAAGISVRTLWRYFPTKEACVQPLLAAGIESVARHLRAWPRGGTLLDALGEPSMWAVEEGIDPAGALALVRLTRTEPGLHAVWLNTHYAAEPAFAAVLAERTGRGADDVQVKVQAAMINAALRVAVEDYVARTGGDDVDPAGIDTAIRAALRAATGGLPD